MLRMMALDRSARAQAQLIDDLLDISRIVAGKLRLEVRTARRSSSLVSKVINHLELAHR